MKKTIKTGIPSEIGILFQIVWLFNIVSSIRRRQIHGRLKKQTYKGARHSREKRTRNIKKYQKVRDTRIPTDMGIPFQYSKP